MKWLRKAKFKLKNHVSKWYVKDEEKGEALILLTDNEHADLSELKIFMQNTGLTNLYLPKKLKVISEFPILGSGKLDFKKLQEIANT